MLMLRLAVNIGNVDVISICACVRVRAHTHTNNRYSDSAVDSAVVSAWPTSGL